MRRSLPSLLLSILLLLCCLAGTGLLWSMGGTPTDGHATLHDTGDAHHHHWFGTYHQDASGASRAHLAAPAQDDHPATRLHPDILFALAALTLGLAVFALVKWYPPHRSARRATGDSARRPWLDVLGEALLWAVIAVLSCWLLYDSIAHAESMADAARPTTSEAVA